MPKIDIYDLSGGQNNKVSPLFIKDNECELVQNYHMDNIGSLTKREGIIDYGHGDVPQIVSGKNILGMYFFNDIQGTDATNILAMVNNVADANSFLFRRISSNWGTVSDNRTAGAIPIFTTFLDFVFVTNGSDAMASTSTLLSPLGTTNCLPTIIPRYVTVWEDRIYALNDNSSTRYPSRIYWSSLPANIDTINGAVTAGDTTITVDSNSGFASTGYIKIERDFIHYTGTGVNTFTGCTGVSEDHADGVNVYQFQGNTTLEIDWDTTNDYADINPDDNDEITWGEPFGKKLLIFKEDALYRWTFGQVEPDKIIDVGTPQGLTVKKVHGICFFANKFGVYAYTGGQPKLISRKVQPWIDAIASSDLTNMRAEVDNDHYKLYIGTVTVDGISYSNAMLVYTISLDAWHVELYPFPITAMARFQVTTNITPNTVDGIYLGDNDGFIYQTEYAGDTTGASIDHNGTAAQGINARIVTKEYPLADFPKTSIMKQLYFLAQNATSTRINYRIDRGDWKPWKDLVKRFTDGPITGRGKTIQFSITDNSRLSSRIEGFSIESEPERAIRREKDARS